MPQNFLSCEREQVLLMPPSLRDWLPEDHLAWFMLASVEKLDLDAFYTSYRADGHGRAAHDPAMMVVRVCAWAALVAGHRAGVCGGHRVSGDRGQPGARSRDDRAVSPAP